MEFRAHDGHFGTILLEQSRGSRQGVECVRQIQAMGYEGRILIMSGNMTAADCAAYQDLAISGFLSEPFSIGMVAAFLLHAH